MQAHRKETTMIHGSGASSQDAIGFLKGPYERITGEEPAAVEGMSANAGTR
jgi:hypothetical protein